MKLQSLENGYLLYVYNNYDYGIIKWWNMESFNIHIVKHCIAKQYIICCNQWRAYQQHGIPVLILVDTVLRAVYNFTKKCDEFYEGRAETEVSVHFLLKI